MNTIRGSVKQKAIVRMAATVMVLGCSAGAATVCWGQAESADSYPTRPIRLIVQFPPGDATDLTARLIGQKLTEAWGQQVIIDNRAGAGGRVGTAIGATAPADGYNLTMASTGAFTVAPGLFPKLPYDTLRDFAPITLFVSQAQVFNASPTLPVKTVAEAIEYARARPGALNYGSVGPGTVTHMAMEMLSGMARIKLTHVPFKGSAAAQLDLISGQVQLMIDSLPAALPMIRTGKVRGLAVTSLERQKFAPELPTMAESGFPGFVAIGWGGVAAPAKTPPAILDKLNRELVRIVNLPDIREKVESQGFNPAPMTRAQFTEFLRSEIDKWTRVAKDIGLRMED
jgi:tripartite-type tricarboxylate transporter receptor subunit TctC